MNIGQERIRLPLRTHHRTSSNHYFVKYVCKILYIQVYTSIGKDARRIVGEGEPTGAKGHQLEYTPLIHPLVQAALWDVRPLLETFLFHPLLIYIAYFTAVVSNHCLKRICLHFKKGTLLPLLPQMKGRMDTSSPLWCPCS